MNYRKRWLTYHILNTYTTKWHCKRENLLAASHCPLKFLSTQNFRFFFSFLCMRSFFPSSSSSVKARVVVYREKWGCGLGSRFGSFFWHSACQLVHVPIKRRRQQLKRFIHVQLFTVISYCSAWVLFAQKIADSEYQRCGFSRLHRR